MTEGSEQRRRERWDVDPVDVRHLGTNVVLNTPVVHEIGRAKAEQMATVINDVAARLGHHPPSDIAEELRQGFLRIGVNPPKVEVERFAEEIARSDRTEAHVGPEGEY